MTYRVLGLLGLVTDGILCCLSTGTKACLVALCNVCNWALVRSCLMERKHGALLLLASLLAPAPVPWMVSDAEFAAFLQSHASVDSSIG